MTVAIHICHRDGVGIFASRVIADRRPESAISVAQQHTYTATRTNAVETPIGHNDVGMAVTIHIRQRDGESIDAARVIADRRLEGAVAVAQQHTYTAIRTTAAETLVGHKHVGMAVAVHIRHCNTTRTTGGVVGLRLHKNRARTGHVGREALSPGAGQSRCCPPLWNAVSSGGLRTRFAHTNSESNPIWSRGLSP